MFLARALTVNEPSQCLDIHSWWTEWKWSEIIERGELHLTILADAWTSIFDGQNENDPRWSRGANKLNDSHQLLDIYSWWAEWGLSGIIKRGEIHLTILACAWTSIFGKEKNDRR